MLSGHIVLDDFFPEAAALREGIDAHFAEPSRHKAETRQVWNYWYVPGLYTCLRTSPERILPREPLNRFFARLRAMALFRFRLSQVTWPYLSLYVVGCQQGLHNDVTNGRLGYVYSLTRWDERKFQGGETLIFHEKEKEYVGTSAVTRANAGSGLYDLIPARFNRLLLFDDRLVHAVPRFEGSMVPGEGRLVMHGHISEGPLDVNGALVPGVAQAAIDGLRPALQRRVAEAGAGLAGLVTVRLAVGRDGQVQKSEILFDRLLAAAAAVAELLAGAKFPAAEGRSFVTVPVPFAPAAR